VELLQLLARRQNKIVDDPQATLSEDVAADTLLRPAPVDINPKLE
jgi:hypothetical protein